MEELDNREIYQTLKSCKNETSMGLDPGNLLAPKWRWKKVKYAGGDKSSGEHHKLGHRFKQMGV